MAYRYRTIKISGKTKLLHRHVAEQKLGRPLVPGEEVHHRNEDKRDNDPLNLDVLPAQQHRQIHADKMLRHPRDKACVVCGSRFTPHKTKRRRNIACSPTCANTQRGRSEKATKSRRRPASCAESAE